MTNSEIITLNYADICTICINICNSSNYVKDLTQEIFLILLETDNTKLNLLNDNNELKFYVSRIVKNNWNSKSSPFYYKYKKPVSEAYIEYIKKDNDL